MKWVLCFLLLFPILQSSAQLTAVKGKTNYDFWLHLPADSILSNRPPVLVFLHGRSLSGTDLNRVKRYGVIHELEKGRTIPAIVIAPQVARGSWEPEKILEVITYVQHMYDTDTCRVYVCGMSMGGYGVLRFAGAYPEKVTAGVALCGGGNTGDACNLAQVPLWIQHGTADEAVPVSESRKIVSAIRSCSGDLLKYIEVKGANHGAMERVFRGDEMYEWLFGYEKE